MDQDLVAMIGDIIEGKGHRMYGLSAINQRAHALQAAWLAEQAGCDAALITACLLHDIGHMVHDLGEDPAQRGIDDRHEALGEAWLSRWFGPEVTEPVRLHVAAKRYLCAAEAGLFRQTVARQRAQPGVAGRSDVGRGACRLSRQSLRRGRNAIAPVRRGSEGQGPRHPAGCALPAVLRGVRDDGPAKLARLPANSPD